MTQKNITDQLRSRFTSDLAEFLAAKYDVDVCQTAAVKMRAPTATAWPMSTSSSWTPQLSARPRPQKRLPRLRPRPRRLPLLQIPKNLKIPSHLKFEKSQNLVYNIYRK